MFLLKTAPGFEGVHVFTHGGQHIDGIVRKVHEALCKNFGLLAGPQVFVDDTVALILYFAESASDANPRRSEIMLQHDQTQAVGDISQFVVKLFGFHF